MRFVTGTRIAKMRKASVCCAGSVKGCVGLDDRDRAVPSSQPSANFGSGGSCFGSPSGVPLVAHRSIDAISAIGERPLADEVADARLDLPRRHEAALRDLRDLRRAAAHLVVRGQAERAGPAGR